MLHIKLNPTDCKQESKKKNLLVVYTRKDMIESKVDVKEKIVYTTM